MARKRNRKKNSNSETVAEPPETAAAATNPVATESKSKDPTSKQEVPLPTEPQAKVQVQVQVSSQPPSTPPKASSTMTPIALISTDKNTPTEDTNSRCASLLQTLFSFALFLSFLGVGFAYCIQTIHDEYFVTLLQRAERTDQDLLTEFTYYDRQCTMLDVTATKQTARQELLLDPSIKGWERMMRHGAVVLPSLLANETLQELQKFVLRKNAEVLGTPSEYPVSQGTKRISYGIEATEDPAVIRALKEIHGQHQLEEILVDLLGPNPALSEITAITASFGAPPQTWHPDTKPDGNALRFARTFMPSYSLFIPLQDTTKTMGATDLCPGTQYCSDELHDICDQHGLAMSDLRDEGVWKAGDAALLNQHVWHRGSKHVGKNEPDRMVFIVTFLGRPHAEDSRQLARGTYFHMKWNMWGHTWQDLKDCDVSMSWPFNVLRCFHLWKPAGRQWGYDLFTSAALRIANRQSGCEPGELETLLDTLDRVGFPGFLDGTVDIESHDAWPMYIAGTINNFFDLMCDILCTLMVVQLLALAVSAFSKGLGKYSHAAQCGKVMCRLVIFGLVGFSMTIYCLDKIRNSKWSKDLASGETLMRPFPDYRSITVDLATDDRTTATGTTTLPTPMDVLVGTRYTQNMGAYTHWLDFHPGNYKFRKAVRQLGGQLYQSYEQGLPSAFRRYLQDTALQAVTSANGRFLQQNFRTAQWQVMADPELHDYVRSSLVAGSDGVLFEMKTQIAFQTALYRFGMLRETLMSQVSQSYVRSLSAMLFKVPTLRAAENSHTMKSSKALMQVSHAKKVASLKAFGNGAYFHHISAATRSRIPSTQQPRNNSTLRPGMIVAIQPEESGDYIPVTIARLNPENATVSVAFSGSYSFDWGASTKILSEASIVGANVVCEGTRVLVLDEEEEDWESAVVIQVYPDAFVDVMFDDGTVGSSDSYQLEFAE